MEMPGRCSYDDFSCDFRGLKIDLGCWEIDLCVYYIICKIGKKYIY